MNNDDVYRIVGAAFEVHRELGGGLLEPVYQSALAVEMQMQGIPFVREYQQEIAYKGVSLDRFYKFDFLCCDNVVVELKSVSELTAEHRSQLFNYMRLSNGKYGILMNFGTRSLQIERYQKSDNYAIVPYVSAARH